MKAIVNIRVKLNLIYLREVERLKIPYQEREEPIILRTFDKTNPTYREGKAYLETRKQIIRVKNRFFNIKFIITRLSKKGIILEIL